MNNSCGLNAGFSRIAGGGAIYGRKHFGNVHEQPQQWVKLIP
jgi:hypothetical protein